MIHNSVRLLRVLEVSACALQGGVMRHVLDIADGLSQSKFDVRLVVSDEQNARILLQERYPNARFIPVRRDPHPSDIKFIWYTIREIIRFKPDILHLHSTKAGFYGRIIGRLLGVGRIIFTPHAFLFLGKHGFARFMYVSLERMLSRFCDVLICVSEDEERVARSLAIGTDQTRRVIRNGVPSHRKCADEELVRLHAAHDIPDDARVILFPARMDYQKDPATFLRAIAVLRKRVDKFVALCLGGGPYADRMKELARALGIEDCVRFAGWIPQAPPYFGLSDIITLTSRYEGLPYALLEALAAGKPIVATHCIGSEDLVVDGINGSLHPIGDAEGLASGLERLLRDPELRTAWGAASRERYERLFTLAAMLHQTELCYAGSIE